ncbi:MAG: Ig-like domain repeat protein [Candidatus Dormibacter sp.]
MKYTKRRLGVGALSVLVLAGCITSLKPATNPATAATSGTGHTVVAIEGARFLINGEVTSPGKPAEGLLLNTRMAQAIFDDANPNTVGFWAYPDTHTWDAQRNTNEFVAMLPTYAQHGIHLVTVGLQGGCPSSIAGHTCPGGDHEWIVSAFNADGSLKSAWMNRLKEVITAADHNGIVVMVQFFYHGQNQRVNNPDSTTAQKAAVNNITDWLVSGGYSNVLVETANECNAGYEAYTDCPNEAAVIKQVQDRSAAGGHRLATAVSYTGGGMPSDDAIAQEDFVLLHGNGIDGAALQALIGRVKADSAYQGHKTPIVVNEDSTSLDNMNAAVSAGVSWGYLDTGTNNYQDGFQRPSVNWTINTDVKEAFFNNALRLAGPASTKIAYSGPTGADFHDAATVVATLTDIWDNPLAGAHLTFTLGSSVCTADTGQNGLASCLVMPASAAGSSSLSIAFAGARIDGLEQFSAASLSVPFGVAVEQVALTYDGDTTLINGNPATLSATLMEDGTTPIAERTITLTLGTGAAVQSCHGTTNTQGRASCTLTPAAQPVGSNPIAATFGGDGFYAAATGSASVTVVTIHTGLSYTGPLSGDVNDAVTLTAQLSTESEAAVPDATLTFSLGSLPCTATTDSTGTASCGVTPNQVAGTYPLTVAFAGDTRFGPATASKTFTVVTEEVKLVYTGATTGRNGQAIALAATLTEDGVTPLVNRSLMLGIGSGSTAQTCTATTDANGRGTCSIAGVNQPVGAGTITASFAGDSREKAATDQAISEILAATVASTTPTSTSSSTDASRLAITGGAHGASPIPALAAGSLLLILGLLLLIVPRRDPPSIIWRNRE